MRVKTYIISAFLLFLGFSSSAFAQSNAYRGSQAYLGLSGGVYGYQGRIDLENAANTATTSKWYPGAAIHASFPIRPNVVYFRGVMGASNFSGDTQFSYSQNAFGAKPIVWLESQAVFPILRNGGKVLPYLFGGFGAFVADPFEGFRKNTEVPGAGNNKPDRSAFSFPVAGLGVDFALSKKMSVFVEGTYRYHWNFLVKSPSHPFSTSFIAGGLRFGLPSRGSGVATDQTPPEIPQPREIPVYDPPAAEVPQPPAPQGCTLSVLNSVNFNYNKDDLDAAAMSLLDENVAELNRSTVCCVRILGYTDEATSPANALRISESRARKVYDYYVSKGIDPSRLRMAAMGEAQPNCNKSDPGKGCRFNRRVESKPMDCSNLGQ
ncbi:MAG TPA: OmpA family protein [Rhodothermales bacterium]|nr:OmpA family protein [Rhodothermales bacterium]